jgi:hypothetical protein
LSCHGYRGYVRFGKPRRVLPELPSYERHARSGEWPDLMLASGDRGPGRLVRVSSTATSVNPHAVFASGVETPLLKETVTMSFVTTQPEALSSAATTLGGIGSSFSAQNAAAASPTTGVVPAAADEVSALTAAQFAAHAQLYQAVAAQAAAIHEQFVNTLATSSGSYAATEAANAAAAG